MAGSTIKRRATHGFTLIELTVVLAVIVTLALILTPSIANFINDSRIARSRSDCQTIASAIVQFYKDNGFFPQWASAVSGGPGPASSRVNVIITPGKIPSEDVPSPWSNGSVSSLIGQLLTNAPGYTLRTPTSQFGWNGPYLSSDVGADPWGNRYMVNVGLIEATQGVTTLGGTAKSAVWVLSAGPNGLVETPYNQNVLTAALGGDDIGIRIQ
jgi:prepilin-type N-terminal cleavage/methylation domain-containing protein